MVELKKIKEWVLNNKQVGKVFSYEKCGELCWSSVAIQKYEGIIKLYIDEILESQMDSENYLREEILKFSTIEEAIDYLSNESQVRIEDLSPCKGQKIFNPALGN
ncbi:hypothetical protein [Marinomonas sp.]|uniref:hypothetical protein n=1 Tax=Marinomonas sp. TaxID=1904862 RepID=UPI003BA9604F